jgi:hypothetical protein
MWYCTEAEGTLDVYPAVVVGCIKAKALLAVCFMMVPYFDPEDGGDMFL